MDGEYKQYIKFTGSLWKPSYTSQSDKITSLNLHKKKETSGTS